MLRRSTIVLPPPCIQARSASRAAPEKSFGAATTSTSHRSASEMWGMGPAASVWNMPVTTGFPVRV